MRRLAPIAAACVLSCAFLPGAALAHQLSGPATVVADPAGYFSYEVTLTIESATALAWFEIDGTDNTDLGHMIFDGFCLEEIEPGVYTTPIMGNLLDPTVAGGVQYLHYLCDGWDGGVHTTILPSSVATEALAWGAVKSLYR